MLCQWQLQSNMLWIWIQSLWTALCYFCQCMLKFQLEMQEWIRLGKKSQNAVKLFHVPIWHANLSPKKNLKLLFVCLTIDEFSLWFTSQCSPVTNCRNIKQRNEFVNVAFFFCSWFFWNLSKIIQDIPKFNDYTMAEERKRQNHRNN